MKNILIINGNPKKDSLNKSLAEQYFSTLEVNNNVEIIHIHDLEFNINLEQGYDTRQTLENDLIQFQEKLKWADHIAFFSPVWWGSMPAKLKGLIDRTFLPGFAFKYETGKSIPNKLLKGKTSEIFVTLDTPIFWYKYFQGNVIYKHLKHTILDFSGIKNLGTFYFGPTLSLDETKVKKWHNKIAKAAQKHS